MEVTAKAWVAAPRSGREAACQKRQEWERAGEWLNFAALLTLSGRVYSLRGWRREAGERRVALDV